MSRCSFILEGDGRESPNSETPGREREEGASDVSRTGGQVQGVRHAFGGAAGRSESSRAAGERGQAVASGLFMTQRNKFSEILLSVSVAM